MYQDDLFFTDEMLKFLRDKKAECEKSLRNINIQIESLIDFQEKVKGKQNVSTQEK